MLDPANGVDGVSDILIRRGRIERMAETVQNPGGARVIEAAGKYVMPGHVDLHAHVSSAWQRGRDRAVGHRMLVESGTTTILDLAGEPSRMAEGMKQDGAGLNVATLLGLIPHETVSEDDPRPPVVRETIASTLEQGAIGVKLLGGYHPFTPEASADVVSVANEMGAWVAFHVGSKDSGSHIDGLREVPGIVGNGRLHVAHINSYCRGLIMSAPEESNEALRILGGMRGQVVTEAYLAQQNGTNGLCDEERQRRIQRRAKLPRYAGLSNERRGPQAGDEGWILLRAQTRGRAGCPRNRRRGDQYLGIGADERLPELSGQSLRRRPTRSPRRATKTETGPSMRSAPTAALCPETYRSGAPSPWWRSALFRPLRRRTNCPIGPPVRSASSTRGTSRKAPTLTSP